MGCSSSILLVERNELPLRNYLWQLFESGFVPYHRLFCVDRSTFPNNYWKLSRSARYNKKRRPEKEQNSDLMGCSSSILLVERNELPLRNYLWQLFESGFVPYHRLFCVDRSTFPNNYWFVQSAKEISGRKDKCDIVADIGSNGQLVDYVHKTKYFISKKNEKVSLLPIHCIALKGVKSREKISVEELLIETLIQEARLINTLIDNEIIKGNHISKVKYRTDGLNEHLWLSLGLWLGMKEPLTRKEKKLKHAMELRNNIESQNVSTTPELVRFRYIVKPECVTNTNGRSLIYLEKLNNPNTITKATDAINHYYFHTLNYPSHWSNNFWKNFIEYFGINHDTIDHQPIKTNFLYADPLSICINEFVREYYGGLYEKLRNLTWGLFAPRTFGVFPMIAINYNTISDFHWDEHDEPNRGELCFPQLQIVIPLRPGQVVAFSSRLLLHDLKNQIERDSHGSIVPMIPQQDLNDARNLNKRIRFLEPKKHQIEIPEKACDRRWENISEDQIPSLK
ncbi:hypothetical protein Glove_692g29 [Diversispora epigaea]|uniref:Uncharacterized protein n=1 Tax=Diversispora epigaea TaxID=1348612 RepID=A0A397G383_9GLOM|nr:hypothetical protein Glove_692g29 [Diversispora epigaea]